MMEKYGTDRGETYEVAEVADGEFIKIHGKNLSFEEAVKLKEQFPSSEIYKSN